MDITAVAKVPIKMTLNTGLPFPRGKCISLTLKKKTLLHMFVFSHPQRIYSRPTLSPKVYHEWFSSDSQCLSSTEPDRYLSGIKPELDGGCG